MTRAYGAFLLTLPWNPYLPVLWWFVFVLAIWSVIADDLAMLPVVVFAGSFCMQTHISYLGSDRRARRRRRGRARPVRVPAAGATGTRDAISGGGAGSARSSGSCCGPRRVIDQFAHSPGNLGIIRDYFSHPPDATIGFSRGVGVMLAQLDPWKLLTRTLVHDGGALEVAGSRVPGALLLVVFGGVDRRRVAAAPCARCCSSTACSSSALALGLVSSARIFGTVWFYLLLWAWALVALDPVRDRVGRGRARPGVRRRRRPRLRQGHERPTLTALAALTVVVSVVFAFQATT